MGYDEATDPGRRSSWPAAPDESPTRLAGTPTMVLGDQVALGHLVSQGETLTRIEGHTKRSADAQEGRTALVRWALEGAVHWLQVAVMVGGVVLGIGGTGALALTVGWLLLR